LFEELRRWEVRDISAAAGIDYVGHSSGAVFFDFDNDGLVDLFRDNPGVIRPIEKGRGGYFRASDECLFRTHHLSDANRV